MTTLSAYWMLGLIGAAIIGFLVAWLLRGSTTNHWKGQFQDKEAAYDRLKGEHINFLSKYEAIESTHQQLKASNNVLTNDLASFQKKYERLERRSDAIPAPITTSTPNPSPTVKIVEKVVEIDNSHEVRAWESKYAKLERDLASKESELYKLQEENDSIYTKLAVLEETAEEAARQKEQALASIKKYEDYKPRFEQANLERNTLKYKYEQLLAAGSTVAFAQSAATTKQEVDPTPVLQQPDNSALLAEIEQLKATIATITAEKEEVTHQLTSMEVTSTSSTYQYEDIKVKYDSLLALHERTDIKRRVLQEQLEVANGHAGTEELAAKLEALLIDLNDEKNRYMRLNEEKTQVEKELAVALENVAKPKKRRKKVSA